MTTRDYDHAHHETRRSAVGRRTFSPAQTVAGIIGLALLIMGGVAMVRVGFDSLTGETTSVIGLEHTLLAAIIHMVAGALFLGAASAAVGSGSQLTGLGVLAIAFGAVVVIEPSPFIDALGEGRPLGIIYLVLGAFSVLTGLTARTIVTTESRVDDTAVAEEHRDVT